jgi:hypothetical protein
MKPETKPSHLRDLYGTNSTYRAHLNGIGYIGLYLFCPDIVGNFFV